MSKRGFRVLPKQLSAGSIVKLAAVLLLAGCTAGGGTSTLPLAPAMAGRSAPMSVASVPVHIATWAYDEYNAGGGNAPTWAVQRYLSYAEAGRGNPKALQDCAMTPKACNSVYYFDPNFEYDGSTCPMQPDASFISAVDESSFVHEKGYTDVTHRVQGTYNESCRGTSSTIPVYLANQNSPLVQAWFQNYLLQNADAWDYYFMDDTSTTVLEQAYGPGGGFCLNSPPNHWCRTTEEYPTNSSVANAHAAFVASLNHANGMPMQFFFNGISFRGQTPQNLQLFPLGAGRFTGAICENCIVSAGTLRPAMYAAVLNAMAQVDAIPNAALVQLDTGAAASGSAAQIAQRTVAIAITWLGYADGHVIAWPDFEYTTKNLAVWPEDLVYPTQPLQTMSRGAIDLEVTKGVYRREFTICYDNQWQIGHCAAIVNSTANPVTVSSAWLQQHYSNVMELSGGDVLNGGMLSLKGSAPFVPGLTTIPAGEAILLGQ